MQGDCAYCSGRKIVYNRDREPLDSLWLSWPSDMCRPCLLMFVEDMKDAVQRISDGCSLCGTRYPNTRFYTHRERGEPVPFTNRTSGLVLFKSRKICWDCWRSVSEDYNEQNPEPLPEEEKNYYIGQIVALNEKITDLKEKARRRDRKYRERKREEQKAEQPSIIASLIGAEDWGQLSVVFGKDSAGTKLIKLASHPSTPETEKQVALHKLVNRRPRWRHRSTTSAEMRSTRPGTKSPLSLASSKGE